MWQFSSRSFATQLSRSPVTPARSRKGRGSDVARLSKFPPFDKPPDRPRPPGGRRPVFIAALFRTPKLSALATQLRAVAIAVRITLG